MKLFSSRTVAMLLIIMMTAITAGCVYDTPLPRTEKVIVRRPAPLLRREIIFRGPYPVYRRNVVVY